MPAGKTYVKIASQALSSTSASVTFSNLPQNYTDLFLVTNVDATDYTSFWLQFNGDTGSNYSRTIIVGDGTSATSERTSNGSNMAIGTANTEWGVSIFNVMNYSNSTTYKTAIARGNNNSQTRAGVGLWRNTAAITSLTVGITSASFVSGSTFTIYGIAASKAPKAIGGTITTDGSYWIHTFTSSGLFIPQESIDNVDYLVVAGGGGSDKENGGGGGAGGLRSTVTATGGGGSLESKLSLAMSTNYTVTVGAGGAASGLNAGSNSVFSTITSTGGGYGGNAAGGSGGSGGGAGGDAGTVSGGAGTANQGYAGGSATAQTKAPSAGGGGAGAVGGNNASSQGGNGGIGVAVSISGASTYYAGGGGGGVETGGTAGTGGTGGGGAGSNTNLSTPTSGTANTGGGAGGSSGLQNSPGAQGGSGIVIVRYPV